MCIAATSSGACHTNAVTTRTGLECRRCFECRACSIWEEESRPIAVSDGATLDGCPMADRRSDVRTLHPLGGVSWFRGAPELVQVVPALGAQLFGPPRAPCKPAAAQRPRGWGADSKCNSTAAGGSTAGAGGGSGVPHGDALSARPTVQVTCACVPREALRLSKSAQERRHTLKGQPCRAVCPPLAAALSNHAMAGLRTPMMKIL